MPDATRKRIVEVQHHPKEVRVFEQGALIAAHPVLEGKNQRRIDPSHRKPVPVRQPKGPTPTIGRRSLDCYGAVGERLAREGGVR